MGLDSVRSNSVPSFATGSAIGSGGGLWPPPPPFLLLEWWARVVGGLGDPGMGRRVGDSGEIRFDSMERGT